MQILPTLLFTQLPLNKTTCSYKWTWSWFPPNTLQSICTIIKVIFKSRLSTITTFLKTLDCMTLSTLSSNSLQNILAYSKLHLFQRSESIFPFYFKVLLMSFSFSLKLSLILCIDKFPMVKYSVPFRIKNNNFYWTLTILYTEYFVWNLDVKFLKSKI